MQKHTRMNPSRCHPFFSVLLLACYAGAYTTVQARDRSENHEPTISSAFGHQAWSSENGLPQNSVHQILQTRDGYLWIATEGGVARFNGFQFTVFNRDTDPAI